MQHTARRRIVIMGAAGRDFHNFNMVYRGDADAEVVAFTAAQIPGIAGRRYPAALAGELYPEGIPIIDEAALDAVCRAEHIAEVVFAYSDVPHATVMHLASRALSAGADFALLGPARTMIQAKVPVIAVSAIRTGCGKSQTTRWISRLLGDKALTAAAIRHPMPYGDLEREAVQRFASAGDLTAAACTIEEREEYEPHIAAGTVVFAGVDYARIVEAAEQEADVILWDGGNNDFPFLRPDLHIVLADALRPDQLTTHHPGEAVLRMADVVVVAKTDVADAAAVEATVAGVKEVNPNAPVVLAASPVRLDDAAAVKGKRAIVVEDGPTITHGGMAFGAGHVAAQAAGATIVDPRDRAAPVIAAVYDKYPHIGAVLPAVGYAPDQVAALAQTIDAADADVVVAATPIDLGKLISVNTPIVRARYDYADAGEPTLGSFIEKFLEERRLGR